ncbi:MAG: hypothetical protein ACE5M4_11045 [Anaerolineales bacterium]
MRLNGGQRTSVLATILLLLVVSALLIFTLSALRSSLDTVGAIDIVFMVLLLAFPLVGWLIARRLPHNPLGWIFLIFPLFLALGVLSEEVGLRAAREGVDSAASLLLIVGGWLQFLGYWLLIGPAILLFPDGKTPGNRFRWALWGSAALLLVWGIAYAIGRDTVCVARYEALIVTCTDSVENSLGLIAGTNLDEAINALVFIIFVFTLGTSVTAVVLRYFRSTGDTRQQIKWVAFTAAAGLLTNVGLLIGQDLLGLIDSAWIELLAFLPILVGLPVAVGVAMFKYRLYDIDRIISRSAAYALIVLVLVAVYVVSVTLIQRLLPIQNQLGIVISTLVVAALFSPLRRRVQNSVDRRFNRSKYDADRVLDEFSRQLRDDVDLEQMQVALLSAAQETMQPSHLSLWVRERGR